MLKDILKGTTILSISSIATKLLSLIYIPILARSLGTTGLGYFNLALAFSPWLIALGSLSMETIITKGIAENRNNPEEVRAIINFGMLTSVVLGLAFSLIHFLLSPFIAINLFNNQDLIFYLQLASPFIFLTITYSSFLGALRGLNEFKIYAGIEVIKQFLIVLTGIFLLVVIGLNVTGALIAITLPVSLILITALILSLKKHDFKLKNPLNGKTEFYKKAIIQTIFDLLSSVPASLDEIFLGIITTANIVGLYGSAIALATYANFFIIPLRRTILPYITEAHTTKEKEHVKKLIEEILKYSIIVLSIIIIGFTTYSNELILFFFGKEFIEAQNLFQILLPIILIMSLTQILIVCLIAMNKMKELIKVQIISIAIGATIGFYYLIQTYQALGAALMLATIYLIAFISYIAIMNKELNIELKSLSKILSFFVIIYLTSIIVSTSNNIYLKIGFSISGISWFIFLLFFFRIILIKEVITFIEENVFIKRGIKTITKMRNLFK